MIDRASVAAVFAAAKDAPTSFEDQDWLEGFEAARCMIAVRMSMDLPQHEVETFLDVCLVPKDEAA